MGGVGGDAKEITDAVILLREVVFTLRSPTKFSVIIGLRLKTCWTMLLILWASLTYFCVQNHVGFLRLVCWVCSVAFKKQTVPAKAVFVPISPSLALLLLFVPSPTLCSLHSPLIFHTYN